jgi:tRNA modification GTPase
MFHGYIKDSEGDIIDEVTVVLMPPGRSYTGAKQVEIFCHGGQFIVRQIVNTIIDLGARPAEPGEFTRMAFIAGRIDLTRAEAVADLVSSKTEYSYNAAKDGLLGRLADSIDKIRSGIITILAEIEASIDYPEEDMEHPDKERLIHSANVIINNIKELRDSYSGGRIIKEGFKIAIAGRPNAGKSSLFNLFLNQDRAIVTSTPGTTRDYLSEWIDLEGFSVMVSDTAGLRKSIGKIELAGQKSSIRLINEADLIIWIIDCAKRGWRKELSYDMKNQQILQNAFIVLNKIDKLAKEEKQKADLPSELKIPYKPIKISCKTKTGYKSLRKSLVILIHKQMPDLTDRLVITSIRHKRKLEKSAKYLKAALTGIKGDKSPELIAVDIRNSISEIDELTGRVYNEDILAEIFSRFCVGK